MANLFDTLNVSSGAIRALQSALDWSQSNVSNASTPGYAKQRVSLSALAADVAAGLPGGVSAGGPVDSRNVYAEGSVWRQVQSQGYYSALASSLSPITDQFDVSGDSGIAGALNDFYQAASAWSVSPNSSTSKQDVFLAADRVAASFRDLATTVGKAAAGIDGQLQSTVDQINALGAQLADLNAKRGEVGGSDPGLDARTYAALEDLAKLTDFTTVKAPDGSLTVLLGGQTPLAIGDKAQAIRLEFTADGAIVRDAGGRDVTAQVSQGQLGGLLEAKNQVLPSILGNSSQAGDLNVLAGTFADRVNDLVVQAGGVPVYSYTLPSAAATLRIDSSATAAGLPAALNGVGNGLAIALAAMQDGSNAADQIGGMSLMAYYGALGGRVGQTQASAHDAAVRQASLVAQAQGLRDDLSGVSLDEEAVLILQYQKGYQAAAQMVTVINDLADSVLAMLR